MKKTLMKKAAAAVMAFALIGGAVSVPVDGKPIFSSALTAKAIGFSATLNESTGVLTINGEVPEDGLENGLREYSQNDKVKKIVCGEDTVFPMNCCNIFGGFECKEIDLSKADTSKVTHMGAMFQHCGELESVDLSSFDTSHVTNMSMMFAECKKLKSVDLSSFDTSRVEYIDCMFASCEALTELDLSNFNTSNVIWIDSMFFDCTNLSDLDISSFDTSNAASMRRMFENCSKLKRLNLKGFTNNKVDDMLRMFKGCSELKSIYVSDKWTTGDHNAWGYNAKEMFLDCPNLVGGNGTKYDANHVGAEYAHVDGGKDNPGYLTKQQDLFKTQNLILSGQIGVSFNLDLSSLTEQERNASYMEFSINGGTSIVPFDKNSKNASGKYYRFTCYVTSVEMADTITAIFHYGDGQTVSKKYSVLDYINAIDKNASSYADKTIALVHSIADYGHYSQPYLAASNNWTIGKEHKEMSKYYTSSYSYDDIKKAASKYQRLLDLGKSDIEKITYSLSLNSGTSLNVFIKAKDNYTGSVKVTIKKGNAATSCTAVKQADVRYKVTIPNISAHQLGDMYTVTASTTNGTATCSLSALSYVYAILSGSSYDKTAKDAVSSLYSYYDATMNYRS